MQPQMQAPQMQPPQMPPMGGMGPSRAGLGTVQDRVDAYRNNPQALQQQYAVSQDMLDLLALQQIKSEKEAAMRNMQLQMAQQSPQQPTVKDQLEGQVMEMTKQDLAKQTGMVGQQQEQQKQQAMQQLMSGIARAPGAANVMPARMAGGGIIAFQGQGAVPFPVKPQPRVQSSYGYTELRDAAEKLGIPFSIYMPRDQYEKTKQRLNEYLRTGQLPSEEPKPAPEPRMMGASPEEMGGEAMVPPDTSGGLMGLLKRGAEAVKTGVFGDRPKFYSEELGYGPPPSTPPQVNQVELDRVKRLTEQGPQFDIGSPSTAIPQLEAQLGRVGPSERAGIERELGRLRQRMAAQPAAMPAGQPPEMPAAMPPEGGQPAVPGVAQPAAQLSRPTIPPGGDFGQKLQSGILSQIGRDPAAEEAARRREAEEYMRESLAKQRGVREQGIESIRASMAERFDPELQRREAIKQFLLSARGRGFGDVIGAGARGSIAYQQQQAEQQRAQQAALMKAQEELAGIDVTQRGKYFEAGAAERQRAEEARRAGLTAGANVLGTMSQAEAAAEQLRSLEARAAAENISRETIAKIQAAAGNNSTEAERIFAEYSRRRQTDPADAEQYLDTITRIKGGGKQESRLAFESLKARQTALLQELQDPLTPPQRKTEVRQELAKVQAAMDKQAGLEPTATPIYAVNPTTKQRIMSTDGGQTWKPAN